MMRVARAACLGLLLSSCGSAPPPPASPPPEPVSIMIADFNTGQAPANNGGAYGAWAPDAADRAQGCVLTHAKIDAAGYALRLEYDVDDTKPAFNGFWLKLQNLDATGFDTLAIRLAADSTGCSSKVKLELKNPSQKGEFLVMGIDGKMREFQIPLSLFAGLSTLKGLTEFVIVFSDVDVTRKTGALLVDDIRLIGQPIAVSALPASAAELKPDNRPADELLDEIQKASFLYFVENCDPGLGFVLDRQNNFVPSTLSYSASSIAATGFGLSALVIGAERGWMARAEAESRAIATLRAMRDKAEGRNGFFYHFIDPVTGKRSGTSELSSIDSLLFIAGALTAGGYFGGEVDRLATALYARMDWKWMLDGDRTLSMGWKPEGGFIPHRWDHYDEASLLYILAIASNNRGIPAESWRAVNREIGEYKGHVALVSGPLFTHQYSHLFVDFRGITDSFADYWTSSINATLANRQFCIDESKNFKTYGENSWGLTACDGPSGYKAYAAAPGTPLHDGTVAPTGALGSYQFTPELSLQALRHMRTIPGLWGRYGPADAYNFDKRWIGTDVIGIDVGAILLSIENARTGLIHRTFMKRPEVIEGLKRIGFGPGTVTMAPTARASAARTPANRPTVTVPRTPASPHIDGAGDDAAWSAAAEIAFDAGMRERGGVEGPEDASGRIRLLWDDAGLHVLAEIRDAEIVSSKRGQELYREDALEIYVDPADNMLEWGSAKDFQLGFAPRGDVWAWFQKIDPRSEGLTSAIKRVDGGYIVETTIPWAFLGVAAKPGLSIGFSAALHDVDKKGSPEAKFNWFFLDPGILLGRLTLGS